MAKKLNNGQKQTSSVEVVFNTANGFAECGIKFEDTVKCTDTRIYAKGFQFPGGKWIGIEALADVIKSGVESTLTEIYFEEFDQSEEKSDEDRAYTARKIGNSVNALYGAFLMLGADGEEAKSFTVKYILDLDLGFSQEQVKYFLDNSMFAV